MLRKRLLEVRPVVCVEREGRIVGIVGRERVYVFSRGGSSLALDVLIK